MIPVHLRGLRTTGNAVPGVLDAIAPSPEVPPMPADFALGWAIKVTVGTKLIPVDLGGVIAAFPGLLGSAVEAISTIKAGEEVWRGAAL